MPLYLTQLIPWHLRGKEYRLMSLIAEQVGEFFDSPFYLEHGRPIIEVRLIIVKELLGPVAGDQILDLGCGDGSLSIPFVEDASKLTLVDISLRMLEHARNLIPNRFIEKVDLINKPLSDLNPVTTYDVVLCLGLLAHVPSIDDAIKLIAQCIKPGGKVVIEFTPNPNPLGKILFPYYWLRRKLSNVPDGYSTNKIPLAQLMAIFKLNGLSFVRMKRHYFPVPTMAWWPKGWLYKYTLFTMTNKLMSRIGTEHIMLFSKMP